MQCARGHEIQPFILNGYPSRNPKGEKLYFCDCAVFLESELDKPEILEPVIERPTMTGAEDVILSAIKRRAEVENIPTVEELRRDVKMLLAPTKKALKGLREKGYILWEENQFRSIKILC